MNDERPDPHLRTALRHAPDADVQAPAALGERLRAAARDAVAADRPPPWWRHLWPRTPMRLGASGAFASLLLAGMVGLLWRGEPPPVEPAPAAAPAAAPMRAAKAEAPPSTPPPRAEAREDRRKELADSVQQHKALRVQPEAPVAARVAKERSADVAPAPVAAAPSPPAPEAPTAAVVPPPAAPPPPPADTQAAPVMSTTAPAANSARRLAAPALPATNRAAGLAAPPASAAATWRRELDLVVAERWRVLEGEPPLTLRRVGNAEVAVDGTRVVLCEGVPRRCREATLGADEARQLAATLPP